MAEQIISPGVFTRENDLTFLPQGVGQIGAAIIGPTEKGPAFIPTVVRSFSEFERYFGPLSENTYVPQTVREYLRNAGSVTVCRVLGGAGYKFTEGNTGTSTVAIVASGGDAATAVAATGSVSIVKSTTLAGDNFVAEDEIQITVGNTEFRFIFADPAGGLPVDSSPIFFVPTGTLLGDSVNSLTGSINDANIGVTAKSSSGLLELTASTAGTSGNEITVDTGSADNMVDVVTLGGGTGATGTGVLLGLLYPSKNDATTLGTGGGLQKSTLSDNTTIASTFNIKLSGSNVNGAVVNEDIFSGSSVNPTAAGYIFDKIGYTADSSKTGATAYNGIPAYTYLNFKELTRNILTTGSGFPGYGAGTQLGLISDTGGLTGAGIFPYGANVGSESDIKLVTQSAELNFEGGIGTEEYNFASTPFIQGSPLMGRKSLFKICTLAHGKSLNSEYKISIANVKEPADINGEQQYTTFSVLLRKCDDDDKSPFILEQFNNVSLDPHSANYIARVIGDRYPQYDEVLNKVQMIGDYPNNSQYIRVEVDESVKAGSLSPKQSPRGFAAIQDPIKASAFGEVSFVVPSASYEGVQTTEDSATAPISYNSKGFLGFKFGDKEPDNMNFLRPLPASSIANIAGAFSVEDFSVHPSASITFKGRLSASLDTSGENGPTANELKFTVPFQGGDDGLHPSLIKQVGENISAGNLYGFDMDGTTSAGFKAYKKALDILSNQDEYDINMLVLPGVIKSLHSATTNAAIDMAEGRQDTFYIMDLCQSDRSVNQAVNAASGLDTSYAAVYYPWVKVLDTARNIPVLVPPSVIVPGAIAQSDRVGAEWFAPAGLNRGVLGNVLEAKINLNQAERDSLYNAKINPIATFPQTGVCIWGQKTLQERATALDRINVRRLLINLKKFVASSSRFLVFEQNTLQTRLRFLNIVNPYLESVQQQQGLHAFRVVMDESNNTPDVIDRNQLVGAFYIQPTRTAEFIILDFNVLPTGATFPS